MYIKVTVASLKAGLTMQGILKWKGLTFQGPLYPRNYKHDKRQPHT